MDLRAELMAMPTEDLVDIVLDQRETLVARDKLVDQLDGKIRELNANVMRSMANTARALDLNTRLLGAIAKLGGER
jgi:hypothetical protein